MSKQTLSVEIDYDNTEEDAFHAGENNLAAIIARSFYRCYLKFVIDHKFGGTKIGRTELATKLRVDPGTINRWCDGPILPRGESIFSFMAAFQNMSLTSEMLDSFRDDANAIAVSYYRHRQLSNSKRKADFVLLSNEEFAMLGNCLQFPKLRQLLDVHSVADADGGSLTVFNELDCFVSNKPVHMTEPLVFREFIRNWIGYFASYHRQKPFWA